MAQQKTTNKRSTRRTAHGVKELPVKSLAAESAASVKGGSPIRGTIATGSMESVGSPIRGAIANVSTSIKTGV